MSSGRTSMGAWKLRTSIWKAIGRAMPSQTPGLLLSKVTTSGLLRRGGHVDAPHVLEGSTACKLRMLLGTGIRILDCREETGHREGNVSGSDSIPTGSFGR